MIKKALAFLMISVLVLGPVVVYAQEAVSVPVELDSLIKIALEKNPEIAAAKKRYDAAKARVPQAKALDDPQITLQFEKIPRGTLKFDKVMPDDRMLTVAQMLPFFGKRPLKEKIALVEAQIAAAEIKDKEIQIAKGIKQLYYDIFLKYQEIALTKENIVVLDALYRNMQERYALGEISQSQLLKIHAQLATLNSDLNQREFDFHEVQIVPRQRRQPHQPQDDKTVNPPENRIRPSQKAQKSHSADYPWASPASTRSS